MNAAVEWLNVVAIAWWNYMVHAAWQASVVGAVLLLVVHLFGRRWPAPLRYALLVLALLKFACPPLLPVPTGLFSHIAPSALMLPLVQERKPGLPSGAQTADPVPAASSSRSAHPERHAGAWLGAVHWTVWLMLCHGLGTCAIAGSVVQQAARLRVLARNARPVRGGTIPRQYLDLAIQLGLSRIPVLAISDEVEGPIAFGVQKSTILLPPSTVDRLTPGELRTVLAHELAHCQRGDLWLNWIQLILAVLWWFHPVVWVLIRSLREVREDCCDDLLLARGVVSNDAYCDVLLHTATVVAPPVMLSAALGFGDRIHPLGRRLARITDWNLQRSDRVSTAGAALVLTAAALFIPGTRAHSTAARGTELLIPNRVPSMTLPASSKGGLPSPVPKNELASISRSGPIGPGTAAGRQTPDRNLTTSAKPPEPASSGLTRPVPPSRRASSPPRTSIPDWSSLGRENRAGVVWTMTRQGQVTGRQAWLPLVAGSGFANGTPWLGFPANFQPQVRFIYTPVTPVIVHRVVWSMPPQSPRKSVSWTAADPESFPPAKPSHRTPRGVQAHGLGA